MRLFALWIVAAIWLWALPPFVQEAIKRSGIPTKDVSLLITRIDGTVVASLNANTPRVPASVIKLFTTYAALRKFGFDYRFPTRFFIKGALRGGVLYGDLYVKGYGDPTLNRKDLPDIVSRIKKAGIVRIEGDIVVDRTYFAVSKENSAHFDNHPYSPYNALPDALMFNERVSKVCIYPAEGRVEKDIPDASYRVANALEYVNRSCRGRYAWPQVKVTEGRQTEIRLWGKLSKRCKKREVCRVVTQPYKSFYFALREALRKEGIAVSGGLRLRKVPRDAVPLFTHYSPPLEKIVAKTAKRSNNLYARHLFLAVGARMFGAPATLQKARKAVMLTLQADGVDTRGLHIDNGSGLSRTSRLKATNLQSLLDVAYRRYGIRWMQTLAIAGKDGTIKRRFRGTPVAGRAWMKTGTLKHAKNIAGYVRAKSGELYETVILVNSKKPRYKAAKMQNDIVEGLVRKQRLRYTMQKRKVTHETDDTSKAVRFYVQIGTFRHCPEKSYFAPVKRLRLPLTISRKNGICKVSAGPFGSRREAHRALEKLTRYFPGSFIVRRAALLKESS